MAFVVAACCAAAWPVVNRYTKHPGETVILLMPPALGALLWFGWPRVRRTAWWMYVLYMVTLTPILAGAVYLVASIAQGRVLWMEVFWALYFTVGMRLAWTVWSWTVGRVGERWRRWGRRIRVRQRSAGKASMPVARTELSNVPDVDSRAPGMAPTNAGSRDAGRGANGSCYSHNGDMGRAATASIRQRRGLVAATRFIGPTRAMLTVLVFVPLASGLLVHRIKIGNPTGAEGRANFPVEEVSFRTADGLVLSGWFLPDRDSDKTVVICHGAGANKSNFVEFMRVFRYQGYNSLIFDFRGHGASEGHTCTFGLYETADVRAAVDWLKKERPERARHVYGLGSSMGAMSLAREAAKDERIEAVVLDSCFAAAPLLVRQHLGRIPVIGPVMAMLIPAAASLNAGGSLWDVDAREAVAAIGPRPILFIHGTEDVLIPRVNMEILCGCATGPKEKWLGPGPHSNIMTTDFAGYQQRVIKFLDKAAGNGRQGERETRRQEATARAF